MPVPDYQSLMLPVLKALADGAELARLMVEYNIGMRTRIRHAIKRVGEDYSEL